MRPRIVVTALLCDEGTGFDALRPKSAQFRRFLRSLISVSYKTREGGRVFFPCVGLMFRGRGGSGGGVAEGVGLEKTCVE